jgi:hypothetical protein
MKGGIEILRILRNRCWINDLQSKMHDGWKMFQDYANRLSD